jgi:redox-sensitive bicupin YhaK (pirin superfamily)
MIEGEVLHRDSLGNEQVIRPGQVNLMTAGHGISHTEDSAAEGARMHAAQLWIALPDAERERAPAFQNHPVLPVRPLGDWQVTVLAGSALGATSPAQVFTPLVGLELLAPAAGEVRLPLDPGFEHAAMVLEGEAWVDGERLDADELLYLPPAPTAWTCAAAGRCACCGWAASPGPTRPSCCGGTSSAATRPGWRPRWPTGTATAAASARCARAARPRACRRLRWRACT